VQRAACIDKGDALALVHEAKGRIPAVLALVLLVDWGSRSWRGIKRNGHNTNQQQEEE
jgi:hypothetical protein